MVSIAMPIAFIFFASDTRDIIVARNVEHICFPAEPKQILCFVAATATTVSGSVIFDGSEDKCA